jgi:uncharacterized protein YdaL
MDQLTAGKPALREILPPPLPHSPVAIYVHSLQAQWVYKRSTDTFESQIRKSSLHITQGNMSNMQQSFNAGQTKGNTQVGKTREACTQGIILSR